MDVLKASVARLRVNSALVALLQIVADVHEAGALESRSELAGLRVTWDQACEPVVRDADRRDDLSLAEVFKASLAENRELANAISS